MELQRLTVVILRSNQELLICMAIDVMFESLRECKTCKLDSEKIMSVADKVVQAGPITSIEFIGSLCTIINCLGEYMIKHGGNGNLLLITELCNSLKHARPKDNADLGDYTRDYFHKHSGDDWYNNSGGA